MASLASPTPSSHPGTSVIDSVRSLLAAALVYVEARLRLAKLESREALRLGIGIAAVAMLALIFLIIAYVGGIVALTLWIAQHCWQGRIIPATLVIAGAHLLAATVSALYAVRAGSRLRLFEASLNELTKDRQWLQTNHPSEN